MPTALQTKNEELNAKRQALAAIFEAAGPDLAMTAEQVDEVKQRNQELADLGKEVEGLRELDQMAASNRKALDDMERPRRTVGFAGGASDAPAPEERKTLGALFVESTAYKEYNSSNSRGPIAESAVEVKTVMTTGAGFAPQAIRTGQVIDSAQQMPKIADVIPATTTTQTAVVYMRETTFTNAAAETAEGSLYPEAALQYSEQNSPVRKISVFLPVTDEQLADTQGMQDRINNRLLLMLRQRLDLQVIAGNGTAPNLTGLLNTSGIQTQAKGTDPNVDAIYKAITKERVVDFTDPSALLMHPTNWQDIRLLRTADGLYIFGNPGEPGVVTVWGLPVVQSTYVTLGTAVVGDFQGHTELAYKAGIEFEVSNSHSDFFERGQLAIRAQFRVALVVTRPTAIVTVTGL